MVDLRVNCRHTEMSQKSADIPPIIRYEDEFETQLCNLIAVIRQAVG